MSNAQDSQRKVVSTYTLISPIQDVEDDNVSTDREDVNGGSANNERIVASFCDADQAAKADEKEEREPQKQPKDLNNVSVQEKTIKGISHCKGVDSIAVPLFTIRKKNPKNSDRL